VVLNRLALFFPQSSGEFRSSASLRSELQQDVKICDSRNGGMEQKRNIDLMKSLSVYIDIDASSSSCQSGGKRCGGM